MSRVSHLVEPLATGMKLSREEFLRRWESLPEVKNAELIGGVVYMPSPVGLDHGDHDGAAITWLGCYAASTPGCRVAVNTTWLMLDDAPQPDAALYLLPEYGGQTRRRGTLAEGAPELIVEVCQTTAAYDLGPKLDLYRAGGVQEFVGIVLEPPRVIWLKIENTEFKNLDPAVDGILRSAVFPGLWLDPKALFDQNIPRLLEVLNQGLQSEEHRQFVEQLRAQ